MPLYGARFPAKTRDRTSNSCKFRALERRATL
jgi:hypothetical protein